MNVPTYNRMGLNYSDFRRPEPKIEAAIWNALDDARSIVNVGAGAGSYEPTDREHFVETARHARVFVVRRDDTVSGAGPRGWLERDCTLEPPYQTAAHRLYESLGYQRASERDEADASGHERLVFRLAL